MAKVHPIEKELSSALKVKRVAKDNDKIFARKLHEAATECDEQVWGELSEEAQGWVNAYTEAKDNELELPGFDYTKAKAKANKEEEPADEKPSKAKAKAKANKEEEPADEKPSKAGKATGNAKGGSDEGYKGHRAGSRKGQVHEVYDEKGAEAATKLGLKLGIAESSIKSWIGSFGGVKKGGKGT